MGLRTLGWKKLQGNFMATIKKSGKLPQKVFIKAAHLQKVEGMPQAQALAVAASYARRGKLTSKGQLKK